MVSSAPISASSPSRPIVALAGARQRRLQHGGRSLGVELGIVGEDHRLELAQLRPGLEPELLDQEPPALAHHLERLGLAAGAVEREHQLAAQPLPERVLGDQRAQLADEIDRLPARQLGRDPLLDRLDLELLEPHDLALRELVEAMVGERRAAPQRQRVDEPLLSTVVGPTRASFQLRLEAAAVDRDPLDLERVPGGPPPDRQRSPTRARRRDTCFCSA